MTSSNLPTKAKAKLSDATLPEVTKMITSVLGLAYSVDGVAGVCASYLSVCKECDVRLGQDPRCSFCKKNVCFACSVKCSSPACRNIVCDACCAGDGRFHSQSDHVCADCMHVFCPSHNETQFCQSGHCNRAICDDCEAACASCGITLCRLCRFTCLKCEQVICVQPGQHCMIQHKHWCDLIQKAKALRSSPRLKAKNKRKRNQA